MATILYINGADRSVYSIDPTQQGQVTIEINLPEGMPLTMLSKQVWQLAESFFDSSQAQSIQLVVIKVTIGS